jgi:hypothetical protein
MSSLPIVLTTNQPSAGVLLLWVVINAFAVARIARLIAVDTITEPIRRRITTRYEGSLVELITCTWCLGIWLAAMAIVLTCAATTRGWWLLIACGFAVAQASSMLNEIG